MKRIFFILLLLCNLSAHSQFVALIENSQNQEAPAPESVTFITTSQNNAWNPQQITKSGGTLTWKAEGSTITTQEVTTNDPTFDFSANTTRDDITITVTSPDGFLGWTYLDLWVTGDPDDGGSQITEADITELTELTYLNFRYCKLDSVNVRNQTKLTEFTVRGKAQLSLQTHLPPSQSTLTTVLIDGVDDAFLPDFTGYTEITSLRWFDIIGDNATTWDWAGQILAQIDANGTINGTLLELFESGSDPNAEIPWEYSFNRDNLLDKGWVSILAPFGGMDASNLYMSQFSDKMAPAGGLRITGALANSTGTHVALVSDNESMMNIYEYTGEPWDMRNTAYHSQFNINFPTGAATSFWGIISNHDNTKFLVTDISQDEIHQYSWGTADDFTSSITFDGSWDPPNSINDNAINMSDDGTLITAAPQNNNTWVTYNLGTAGSVLGTNSLNSSGTPITAGSETHYLATYNDGKNVIYSDVDGIGFGIAVAGTYDTPDIIDGSFSADESRTRDWQDITDSYYTMKYIPEDKSFLSGSWGNDHLIKFRDISRDEYLTGKEYDIDIYDDIYAGIVPIKFADLGTTFSFVLWVKIPDTGVGILDNELLGSTSSNYLRFDHNYSTDQLFVQIYDGTAANSNGASFVADDEYHQIVLTYSTANNQKIYVDGTLVDTGVDVDQPDWSTVAVEQFLQLGSRSSGTSWGEYQIKGLQVYNTELTGTQVSNINTDFTNTATGLQVYAYNKKGRYFWEDESGNGNHIGVENISRRDEDEYFRQRGAGAIEIEENSLGDIIINPDTDITVVSGDTPDGGGDYAYRIESTNNNYAGGRFEFEVISGETYQIKLSTKAGTGNVQELRSWTGWTSWTNVDISGDSTWTERTFNLVASATGTADIRINATSSSGGFSGDYVLLDKITIKKQ